MNASLEVAIAREHRGDDQILIGDRFGDVGRQRPRVADAGRAAVADDVEAERVERVLQIRLREVVGHDFGTRRERGLDPRLRLQSALDRIAREQSRADHHGRIRRIGAARDRGDHDRAVGYVFTGLRNGRRSAAAFVEKARHAGAVGVARFLPFLQRDAERRLHVAQRHAILRSPRTGKVRLDGRQIEFERVGELRIRRCVGAEKILRLRVRFDQRDVFGGAAREAHVLERAIVDREDRTRRTELGRHIADRGAVGNGQRRESLAVELDELSDDALLAQHLGDREHQIGRGDAFAQLAVELETDHFGDQHRHRLAEHRGLGFDAADAPREHADAVDHRRVRIGPDRRIRIRRCGRGVVRNARTAGAEDDAR